MRALQRIGPGEDRDASVRRRISAPDAEQRISPEEERIFSQVCPGGRLTQDLTEGRDDLLWGPFLTIRTGSATDSSLRHRASSGGVLSALLLYLLDSKTVDYVVQVKASETRPIANATVESVSKQDIFRPQAHVTPPPLPSAN